MDEGERELDLDILSTSWRSMSDIDAWWEMLRAWERKLDVVERRSKIPLLDGILRNQLTSIGTHLDQPREIKVEDPLELAVSETPSAAMVLSPEGLVVTLNAAAQSYFGLNQGMHSGTDWVREDSLSDYIAIRDAHKRKTNSDYAIIRINAPATDTAFAEVYPLGIDGMTASYTVVRSLELEWYGSVSKALRKAFGMTRAESEVCRLIFAHRDLAVVARERGVALETVRTQLKRILNKIEVHSKAELVRLLALLCARAANQHDKKDLSWSDPLGREEVFKRRDGRRLAFSWVGAEHGRPILYVPGQTSFNFVPEKVRSALKHENVKLITLSLPGHGNSDPSSHKDQLIDGCDGIEEWCEALQSGPIPVMASRGAQFYIFRLAKLRPDLFSFLLCVGLPWNITPARTAGMSSEHMTLYKLALDAPLAYDVVCRIGYHMLKMNGPDFYWQKVYSGNPADIAVSNNIEMRPLLRATIRHIVAQGYETFKREQEFCARSPLPEWVKATQVPFHWMVPGFTAKMTDQELKEVEQLNPLATLEVVEETGVLLPFQKPDLFVDRLVALASSDPAAAFSARFGSQIGVNRSI